jgi:hypothetical protein
MSHVIDPHVKYPPPWLCDWGRVKEGGWVAVPARRTAQVGAGVVVAVVAVHRAAARRRGASPKNSTRGGGGHEGDGGGDDDDDDGDDAPTTRARLIMRGSVEMPWLSF